MTTFGVACVPEVPPERIPDVARAAEAAGLDEMWVWEDCFWASGTSGVVAALAATERITVGVSLLPDPLSAVGYVDAAPGEDNEQVAARARRLAEGGAGTVLLSPHDRATGPYEFIALAAQVLRRID
jgi:hypothetical protein